MADDSKPVWVNRGCDHRITIGSYVFILSKQPMCNFHRCEIFNSDVKLNMVIKRADTGAAKNDAIKRLRKSLEATVEFIRLAERSD